MNTQSPIRLGIGFDYWPLEIIEHDNERIYETGMVKGLGFCHIFTFSSGNITILKKI